MANTRIRLAPQTIEILDRLGQQCGITDPDTLIQLLIRKYGSQLVSLLAPTDPNWVSLTQAVPTLIETDPICPISQDFEEKTLDIETINFPINDLLSLEL